MRPNVSSTIVSLLGACAVALTAAACNGDSESDDLVVVHDTTVDESDTGTPGEPEKKAVFESESPSNPSTESTSTSATGSGTIATPAPEEMRTRRRMDIDQLDASLRRVTGGIGWDAGQTNRLDQLSQTLGKPDFADSTKETLSPTPVFHKFLGDAARHVCRRLTDREYGWANAGTHTDERRLLIHARADDTYQSAPSRIDENLRALLLNFHGRRVDSDSATLAKWRTLFQDARKTSGKPRVAWRTVCVTLIKHPDFFTY